METNLEIEEIKKKYNLLKENVYDYSGAKDEAKDFENFKGVISNFEIDKAPELNLFPTRDLGYWIIKTALLACYAGAREYKNDKEKRNEFMDDLLTTFGYTANERKTILKIAGHGEETAKETRLEKIVNRIKEENKQI
jgi:hypothetical protein